MAERMTLPCPACDDLIEITRPYPNQEVSCPNCEVQLVIASVEPLELAYALDADDEVVLLDEPQ